MGNSILFLGVDPGLSGAVAVLDPDTNEVQFYDAPVLEVVVGKKNKHVPDAYGMVRILKEATDGKNVLVTIEKVGAMPGQGVTSMFTFGYGAGMWMGILSALGIPHQTVHPATWKAALMKGCGKEKDASRQLAMQHYPKASARLARKKDDGRADALMLARYGWVTYGGRSEVKPKEGLFD